MQNWSPQTKQYFLVAIGIIVLSVAALSTLYVVGKQGNALPDVLHVLDGNGETHGPHSPLSREAIRNLRKAGLDTIKKDYPYLVLLNNATAHGSEEPLLLMSDNIKDLPRLIQQGQAASTSR